VHTLVEVDGVLAGDDVLEGGARLAGLQSQRLLHSNLLRYRDLRGLSAVERAAIIAG